MKHSHTVKSSGKKKQYQADSKKSKISSRKLRTEFFPIVGIGASAGGIKAFTSLLESLHPDLGMAFVLILHLSPHHKSALAEIMQFKTSMKVQTAKDGMAVLPNNVYVIPPNTFISIKDGRLKFAPRPVMATGDFSVDYFLTTLAAGYKNSAIGIILSGTATDGTLGLKAIKAEGGITFAQDGSAEFNGMPGHAYDAGYVDLRLPPKEIAMELQRLTQVPYTILPPDKIEHAEPTEINEQGQVLQQILALIKARTGIDFFLNYKHASIYRRIIRRMALNKFEKLSEYFSMLRHNSREVDALYADFLINVTCFFRNPDFYKILAAKVFPAITNQEKSTEPFRIWIAGCSSGEEAYSVAIHLIEFLERKKISVPIQIFASDLDSNAIEKARAGAYPAIGMMGISPTRLSRFFIKRAGFYQISKSVREVCVFSQHNLLKDPPFPRMDLISCQNVLIYLDTIPQEKILQMFHYALQPNGFLCLGKSETIGTSGNLFRPLDRKIKIYSKKPVRPQFDFAGDTIKGSTAPVTTTARAEVNVEKAMSKL
ncbi:MAG TPA: CheR family methyltransferase, partial [Ohtaekwangia sp.]|nr:CheR family methyltransferase [Ohtaekwangia sp.]